MIEDSYPLGKMYEQRRDFTIVALTGITGSGCSDFATMMSMDSFDDWKTELRSIEEVNNCVCDSQKKKMVFVRNYEKCYNYCEKNHQSFKVIKYKNVLIFYLLRYLKWNFQGEEIKNQFVSVLESKFHHSYIADFEDYSESDKSFIKEFANNNLVNGSPIMKVLESLDNCRDAQNDSGTYQCFSSILFDEVFEKFCEDLYDRMKDSDYYYKNFFVHRLASSIRATGNPLANYDDYKTNKDNSHIFEIVELINQVIKGYHFEDKDKPRRFVIDSIRNSMEILYLRERYNAFYMIALHNDQKESSLLENKVKKYTKDDNSKCSKICNNIMGLSRTETSLDDFEEGKLSAPDLSRCVSESEIHISYRKFANNEKKTEETDFCSFTEQWMKYYSLICRPGIITPSCDERNMSIAYVAKFNSGCLSRQVGCAIVDKENSVQSIGWNDPPAAQLPCSLRYVKELIEEGRVEKEEKEAEDSSKSDTIENQYSVFSKFELEDRRSYKKYQDGSIKGFCSCLTKDVSEKVMDYFENNGLSYPYCFRTRYNKYMGNKDNVNTRSLHAEENAMLRISHRGGIGLDGGTMYVTASPCVLCSKKAFQIGITDIVYLDPYTDIATDLVVKCGVNQPRLRPFKGAIGATFFKLYQAFLPYKDEISIVEKSFNSKEYEKVGEYVHDFAKVRDFKKEKYNYIDKNENVLCEKWFDECTEFLSGFGVGRIGDDLYKVYGDGGMEELMKKE